MAAQYAPLMLPKNLDAMPVDYQRKIPLFDGTQGITAQQHVDKMTDFFDLYEIDEENVTMRLFVQTFGGEVQKWFKALPARTINTLAILQIKFLDCWQVKKNPLQIISKYENINRNVGESVQDYCVRFNIVYNAIPADIKPPMGLDLIKFPDGFDPNMAYQLRERDPATLEDMQKIAVSIEANLLAKRARTKTEKKVTIKEEASPSYHFLHKIKKMFDRLTIVDKPKTHIRNPNFCGQQQQWFRIKQREQRAQYQAAQQQVKTPSRQNFVHGLESDYYENIIGEEKHFFTPDDLPIYIMEDEEYSESPAVQKVEDFILANETVLEEESDEYQRGYMNSLTSQQRQYSLRSREVPINPIQKRKEAAPPKNDSLNVQKKGKEAAYPTTSKTQSANEKSNQSNVSKEKTEKKDAPLKEVEKTITFSLENDISKLKVSIPLTELRRIAAVKIMCRRF